MSAREDADAAGRQVYVAARADPAEGLVNTTNDDRTAALDPWLKFYNAQRRHCARRSPADQPTVTNLTAEYT